MKKVMLGQKQAMQEALLSGLSGYIIKFPVDLVNSDSISNSAIAI